MPSSVTWKESAMTIAGSNVHLMRGGSGRPVLVLHHDIGTVDRLPFYDALAQNFDVLVPHHPGWGKSERPQWLRSVRDIAAMHSWLLSELGLSDVRWWAWASAAGSRPRWPASRRPRIASWCWSARWASIRRSGYIADQAIVSYIDYPQAGFHDQAAFARVYGDVTTDQLEQWDICREMVFRTAWKPYMYSQTLPHLLGGVKAPALVVWGDDDRHVPKSAGDVYVKALRNARLETVAGCGHYVDMEKPDELARLVSAFVNAN